MVELAQKTLKQKVFGKIKPSDEEWQFFIEKWQPFSFEKNTLILDVGATENYFYFVQDGLIRVYFNKDGEEFNLGFSYHGDFSGVYDSFVTQTPSKYAMEAVTNVEGIRISNAHLNECFDTYKVFEKWGRLFNEMMLVGLGTFIKSIIADSAEERFRQLMARSPHVIQIIPQKHLASYLGMTPETFSRMRKKWME